MFAPQLINLPACPGQLHLPNPAAYVLMLLNPSVLFFCLSASLMLFRVDAVVVVARARQRLLLPPSPLPSASRAPVNFVVFPPCLLSWTTMRCTVGRPSCCSFSEPKQRGASLQCVSGCPCLALSLWEFPLPL